MNIEKYKKDHINILKGIEEIREATVKQDYYTIISKLSKLKDLVIQHIAMEDRVLYPTLRKHPNPNIINVSIRFKEDMSHISVPFIKFSRKWNNITILKQNLNEFKKEANIVLKDLYDRMKKEDRGFYPLIEREG